MDNERLAKELIQIAKDISEEDLDNFEWLQEVQDDLGIEEIQQEILRLRLEVMQPDISQDEKEEKEKELEDLVDEAQNLYDKFERETGYSEEDWAAILRERANRSLQEMREKYEEAEEEYG